MIEMGGAMLSHFSVKNYKCLADVSLPLTPIHVLIGQNDTGKTSLLEAIRAGIHVVANLTGHRVKPTNPFTGDWYGRELLWPNAPDGLVTMSYMTSNRFRQTTSLKSFQCSVRFTENREKLQEYHHAEHWLNDTVWVDKNGGVNGNLLRSFPVNLGQTLGAHIFRFRPRIMARGSALSMDPRYTLEEDGFGLPTLLSEIQDYDNRLIQQIQDSFRRYFPQYTRIRLENTQGWVRENQPNGITMDMLGGPIGKQVWLATGGSEIRLQRASDGVVLILGFLALKHSPRAEPILLVEEPENGVHPKRLIEIAKLLRQFVDREENAPQIILTTHSPYLLSEFKPEEVTLMRRQPDGSAKAFPIRDAKHIKERMGSEFYLGELWYNLTEEEFLK